MAFLKGAAEISPGEFIKIILQVKVSNWHCHTRDLKNRFKGYNWSKTCVFFACPASLYPNPRTTTFNLEWEKVVKK